MPAIFTKEHMNKYIFIMLSSMLGMAAGKTDPIILHVEH